MDRFTFFFPQGSSPCVIFSFSKFNLKYKKKKKNFSRISFSKLSRWLRYSIKIFSAVNLWVITNSVPWVHFTVLDIYVYPSRWPTCYVKTCFIDLLNVGRCERKTSYSTFKLNLLQHLGEHSISIETPTSSLTSFHY